MEEPELPLMSFGAPEPLDDIDVAARADAASLHAPRPTSWSRIRVGQVATVQATRGEPLPISLMMPTGVITQLTGWCLAAAVVESATISLRTTGTPEADESGSTCRPLPLGTADIYMTHEARFCIAYGDGTNFKQILHAENLHDLADVISGKCGQVRNTRMFPSRHTQRAMGAAYETLLTTWAHLLDRYDTPIVDDGNAATALPSE